MSDAEVLALSRQLGSQAKTRTRAVKRLLAQGGLLLVELDLIKNPALLAGTIFMADEIHQYILYPKAAALLAQGAAKMPVHYIGGEPARTFTHAELLEALRTTKEFDQLEIFD